MNMAGSTTEKTLSRAENRDFPNASLPAHFKLRWVGVARAHPQCLMIELITLLPPLNSFPPRIAADPTVHEAIEWHGSA